MENKNTIIAIDGPAGAGKSTIAKLLAKQLGFSYLDTGAMYRTLTLKAMRTKVNLEDEDALADLAKQTTMDIDAQPTGIKISLDGEDVSQAIRTLEVTNNTFYIARAAKVREIMVEWQRAIGAKRSVVVDGRDIGTVVFPNAPYKFYLDATPEERCSRRAKELREKGQEIDEVKLLAEIKDRDNKDFTRKVGPLKQAPDAIYIDSTPLSIDQVVENLLSYIR